MKSKVSSTLRSQTRRYASEGTERSSLSRPITHLAKPACHLKNSSQRWGILSGASVVNSATNTLPSGGTKPSYDSCRCRRVERVGNPVQHRRCVTEFVTVASARVHLGRHRPCPISSWTGRVL